MAILDLAQVLWTQTSITSLLLSAITSLFTYILLWLTVLDPLRKVPGPMICRFTPLWMWYHAYIGDECSVIDGLFQIYGPVLRIAPNEVIIADGAALAPIHSDKGGFRKAPCYANFDFEGHPTIFSALSPEHRLVRSKAVLPLFSIANIRSRIGDIENCVDKFVDKLNQEAELCKSESGKGIGMRPVNILNLSRCLSLDSISAYLFNESYGGLHEQNEQMSAAGFVDFAVAIGRVFYIPNWLFKVFEYGVEHLLPANKQITQSMHSVDSFADKLATQANDKDDTYQSRLFRAGITTHEIAVQCKDLMFAGTDSTGANIAKIVWQLARCPDIYHKLQSEIEEVESKDPGINPQAIAYLDAVVREGLRLGMANPTRFPRVVPDSGFAFTASNGKECILPPGCIVGVQAYSLHMNEAVFPQPSAFKPERWIHNPTSVMQRDWFAFGQGSRQCIARNLAYIELLVTIRAVAKANVLKGARVLVDEIKILEWFNSKVVDERIDLTWS